MSIYLYGLVRGPEADSLKPVLEEVEHSKDLGAIRIMKAGSTAMIISDVLSEEVRPKRRNLLTHMRVLEAVLDQTDVLPARFGQLFANEEELLGWVNDRVVEISAEIDRLTGLVEQSVRIKADRDKIIAALSLEHPELRESYIAASKKGPAGHYELIEIGKQIGALLSDWRSEAERQLLARFTETAEDFKLQDFSEDTEVLRCDFLLKRQNVSAFETECAEAIRGIALVQSEDVQAHIVGPSPPSSFVRLDLDTELGSTLGTAA